MAKLSQPIPVSAGGGCDIAANTMTRAALLNARNAGNLVKGCHYWITDYSYGTVGSATVMLHAVDTNVLSTQANVQTSFDNVAWSGEYDIDKNRITRLHDNLGNKVGGSTGVEVGRFPWGDARYTLNTVDNATWLADVGTGATISNNTVQNNFYLDTRGITGTFRYNRMATGGRAYLRNSTALNMQNCALESTCYLNLQNTTNQYLNRATFQNQGYVYVSGAGRIYALDSLFAERAYIRVTAGLYDTRQSQMNSYAYVYVRGLNTVRLWQSSMSAYSRLLGYSASGILDIRATSFLGGAYFYRQTAATGNMRLDNSTLHSRAYFRDNGQGTKNFYYLEMGSRGEFYMTGNVNGTYSFGDEFGSYCRIYLYNRQNVRFYYNKWSSGLYFFIQNGGTTISYIQYNEIGSLTRIYARNITGAFRMQYNEWGSNTYAYLDNGANPWLVQTHFSGRSQFQTVAGSNGRHYRLALQSYAIMRDAGFSTQSCYVHGRITHTLTANSNNKGRDYFNNSF